MRPSKKTCAIGLALATALLAAGICWSYRVELFILPREWAKVLAEIEAQSDGRTFEQTILLEAGMNRVFALNGKQLPSTEGFKFWPTANSDLTGVQTFVEDESSGVVRWSLVSSNGGLRPHELVTVTIPLWSGQEVGRMSDPTVFRGRAEVRWVDNFAFECASDGMTPLGYFTGFGRSKNGVAEGARTNENASYWRVWSSSHPLKATLPGAKLPKADADSSRNHALRYLHYANVVDDSISDIEALLQHPDRFVRARAIATLGEAPSIPQSLTRFLESRDNLIRGSAQCVLLCSTDSMIREKAVLGCVTDRRPLSWDLFDISLDDKLVDLAVKWIEEAPHAALDVIRDRLGVRHTRRYLRRLSTVYRELQQGSVEHRFLSRALCRTGDLDAVSMVLQQTLKAKEDDTADLIEILLAIDPPADVPRAWTDSMLKIAKVLEGPARLRAHALLVHWESPNGKSLLVETLESRLNNAFPSEFDDSENFDAMARSSRIIDFLVSSASEEPERFGPVALQVLARSPTKALEHKRSIEHLWRFFWSRDLWVPAFTDLIENSENPDLDALLVQALESTQSPTEARILLTVVNGWWNRLLPIEERVLRRWMTQKDEREFALMNTLLPDPQYVRLSDDRDLLGTTDFKAFDSNFSASAEAALLLLRSEPAFLEEFIEGVARPGNRWLLSSRVLKALSPQVIARLEQIRWPTESQRELWKRIRARQQATTPRRSEDLSLWERYEQRLVDFKLGFAPDD